MKHLVKRALLILSLLSAAIAVASEISNESAQSALTKKVQIVVKGHVCRMLPVALVAGFSIPFEIGAVGVELGTVVWTFGAAVAGVIGLWFSKKFGFPRKKMSQLKSNHLVQIMIQMIRKIPIVKNE